MVTPVVREIVEDTFPVGKVYHSLQKQLCYSIAHKETLRIPLLIQNLAQTSPQLFNTPSTEYRLTPLHVCAIVQDYDTAAKLLDFAEVELIPDLYKWTPLHVAAALGDEKMKTLILAAQKADKYSMVMWQNDTGGTYKNIERWLTIPETHGNVFSFIGADGQIHEGNAATFKEMTGAEYCPEVVVTSASLLEEWSCPHERNIDEHDPANALYLQTTRQSFTKYRATPSKLILSKQDLSIGCDVIAGQDFSPGDVVSIYGGVQKAKTERSDPSYVLGRTDGKKVSNFGPMINDSFPNCTSHCTYDVEGLSEISFLVACDPIRKGERICWNYGSAHGAKNNQVHKELRMEAIEQFFKDFPISNWVGVLKARLEETIEDIIKMDSFAIKLRYFFETPNTLLICFFKGLITPQQVRNLIINEEIFTLLNLSHPSFHTLYVCDLFERLVKIDENPPIQNFLSLLSTYSHETLLIAFAFWNSYSTRANKVEQLESLETIVERVHQLNKILHDLDLNNLQKAEAMGRVFLIIPSNELRSELYNCFLLIIAENHPRFLKSYKRTYGNIT